MLLIQELQARLACIIMFWAGFSLSLRQEMIETYRGLKMETFPLKEKVVEHIGDWRFIMMKFSDKDKR